MEFLDGRPAPAWLRVLARQGSYLTLTAGGAEAYSPRNQFSKPVAKVDRKTLTAAIEAGLLRDIGENRLGPTPKALAALRAEFNATAAEAAAAKQTRPSSSAPAVNEAESPLSWLRRRRDKDGKPLITDEQFAAGERLRADFWFAQMTPKVTSTWDATYSSRRQRRAAPGAGIELQDHVIAARERVRQALKAVGPELSGILIDVCCHLKGLEEAEKAAGWPQRSGKVVLQLALTRLARHYGMLPSDESSRPPRIRHWGTPDYRPTIEW
ncbi:MAG: DUF6456 domain-containing protein [Pseudomonadota bacterium]|jgi:hypothetical protein